MHGLFISFEGGEGVGKSTQIARLADRLRGHGHEVIVTLEPGGTPLGTELRRLVLNPDGHVTPRAEALLYAADRAHHVDTVIEPALAAGKVVITDRYADSSLAYQGVGRALDPQQMRELCEFAVGGRWPEVTILLDVDPIVGLRRARGDGAGDRIEAEGLEFHKAVRAAFLDLAGQDPDRFVVVDASGSLDEVAQRVRVAVDRHLESLPGATR
ncbi:dTMP kinase [Antricoccus suffuscus]|uniref:Thymidylate kinase n=1 Tax=Antricoccus suffuscus TaxID=1629062 RepID=A0A2T1A3F6_9ACTN|nr:dTMP kinase [Antricoccus suffuscus]PRZ43140.1 dTMP kinase [Antricoccus suffuscus]